MQNQEFVFNAVLKVVHGKNAKIADFEFVKADPSFEKLLKSSAQSIDGERCSDVLHKIGVSDADLIPILKKAYRDHTTQTTKIYCNKLDLYFRIQATRQKDNTVLVHFVNSSAEKYLEQQLIERRKEFKIILFLLELYDLNISAREILEKLVARIPESWQYPDHTYCRITLNGDDIASENYQSTRWKLRRPILKNGMGTGFIEVGYVKQFPRLDSGPFLREEEELLEIVAKFINEIIKNKTMYENLQASRSLLDRASTLAKIGAWNVDLSNNTSTWSDQVAEIHELPPGSAPIPEEGIRFYEPEYRDKIANVFQRCAEDGIPYNEVMAIRTAKGNHRWVKTTGEPVRDETGEIVKVQGAFQDITENINAQQALRESEQQFRQIFYNHTAVKLIIEPETTAILYANSSAAKFYGWTVEELENMHISDINVLSTDGVRKKMRSVQSNQSSHFEFKHRKADGTISDVEVFTSNVMIDGRQYLHSIIHDITEKKKAEKALIQNEKILSAMISASPLAIYRLSPEGLVESWNMAAEKMFGWTSEELIGKPLPIVPENKQDEFKKLRTRVLQSDSFTEIELKRQKKDGSKLYISLSTACLTDSSGKVVSILSMASDITRRRDREEWLRVQSKALNSAANAIIITDKNGNIEWVNDAWTALTGFREDEVIGENPRVLKSGMQNQSFYAELWDTILRGNVWQGEMINKRNDGSLYHEYQTITPLLDSKDKVRRFIGIKQDITELKNTEKELQKLVKEKEVLLSEVHHRVKNNLAIVSSMLEMQQYYSDNPELGKLLKDSTNRIRSMALIHESLYQTESFSEIPLQSYLQTLLERIHEISEGSSNVTIELSCPDLMLNVNQAIPTALIINEVISNSLEHAFSKQINGKVQLSVEETEKRLYVLVKDNGKGLPQHLIDQIEQPSSYGFVIIKTLIRQLDSDFNLWNNGGANISFSFKKEVVKGAASNLS